MREREREREREGGGVRERERRLLLLIRPMMFAMCYHHPIFLKTFNIVRFVIFYWLIEIFCFRNFLKPKFCIYFSCFYDKVGIKSWRGCIIIFVDTIDVFMQANPSQI